jgi:hypothetical protein
VESLKQHKMDNLKDFTAQDARKNMNSLENSVNKKLLETILERINEKSKLNEESYSTNHIPTPVQAELERRGFKVKYYGSQSSDPREGPYYTISW